jgi:hypothetical protein
MREVRGRASWHKAELGWEKRIKVPILSPETTVQVPKPIAGADRGDARSPALASCRAFVGLS